MTTEIMPIDKIINLSAQRAAKEAAEEFAKDKRESESTFAVFAVYAWATVAVIGSLIGGSALMLPNDQQSSQQIAVKPTVGEKPVAVLAAKPAEPQPIIDPVTTAATKPALDAEKAVPVVDGVLIGGATDLDSLVLLYAKIENSLPGLLDELPPLVQFQQEGTTLTASLLAGPFKSRGAMSQFCKKMTTTLSLSCSPTEYSGDPLLDD